MWMGLFNVDGVISKRNEMAIVKYYKCVGVLFGMLSLYLSKNMYRSRVCLTLCMFVCIDVYVCACTVECYYQEYAFIQFYQDYRFSPKFFLSQQVIIYTLFDFLSVPLLLFFCCCCSVLTIYTCQCLFYYELESYCTKFDPRNLNGNNKTHFKLSWLVVVFCNRAKVPVPTLGQSWVDVVSQRRVPTLPQYRADEQNHVGPTLAPNMGPTQLHTLAQHWPNMSLLSGS